MWLPTVCWQSSRAYNYCLTSTNSADEMFPIISSPYSEKLHLLHLCWQALLRYANALVSEPWIISSECFNKSFLLQVLERSTDVHSDIHILKALWKMLSQGLGGPEQIDVLLIVWAKMEMSCRFRTLAVVVMQQPELDITQKIIGSLLQIEMWAPSFLEKQVHIKFTGFAK